ncbi:MAG: hypothetical protein JJE19_07285 [Methanosarcinales archaeon]|nr:hypothetical protein [Methanosarcinales archaeon]
MKEIANVSKMPLKKTRRENFFLLKNLEIKLAPADPTHYMPRFCSELRLNDAIRERAIKIIKASKETAAARGWSPTGSAAAVIYIATISSGSRWRKKNWPRSQGQSP